MDKLYHLNSIEISEGKLDENITSLMAFNPSIAIAPVLKANAYGHGIELIGTYLDKKKFPFYCVNSIVEANQLRMAGVKTDILIMGYVGKDALNEKEWDYIFGVFDLEQAKMISSLQKNPRVHINIETGLHREGLDIFNLQTLLSDIKLLSNLNVEGVMSHLSCSNDPECETTIKQLAAFKQAKELALNAGFTPHWYHFGGSLALLNKLSESCNVIRCGKALFGIALNSSYQADTSKTSSRIEGFSPILEFKTHIAQIKKIKKGDHVSYADAFIADKDMTIGILPVGYSDGVERRLTNKGYMKVDSTLCKMLGVVAMNVTIIDLSDVKDPHVGHEVIIYSSHSDDQNSLDHVAQTCGTLPQDLLSHLSPSIPREFVR